MLKLAFISFFLSHRKRKIDRNFSVGPCNNPVQAENPSPPWISSQCSKDSLRNKLLTSPCGLRPCCFSPIGLVIIILSTSGKILKEHNLKKIGSLDILENAWQKKSITSIADKDIGKDRFSKTVGESVNWYNFFYFFWRAIYKTYGHFKCVNIPFESLTSSLEFHPTEGHPPKCSQIFTTVIFIVFLKTGNNLKVH